MPYHALFDAYASFAATNLFQDIHSGMSQPQSNSLDNHKGQFELDLPFRRDSFRLLGAWRAPRAPTSVEGNTSACHTVIPSRRSVCSRSTHTLSALPIMEKHILSVHKPFLRTLVHGPLGPGQLPKRSQALASGVANWMLWRRQGLFAKDLPASK